MVEFDNVTAPTQAGAARVWVQQFAKINEDDGSVSYDTDVVRATAIKAVRKLAVEKVSDSDDGLINIQYVYDEIRRYDNYLSDPTQPTPNGNRYKNAGAIAAALGVSITTVLDEFRNRWINAYTASASIVAERQRVIGALNAASTDTVEKIEAILAGINWQ